MYKTVCKFEGGSEECINVRKGKGATCKGEHSNRNHLKPFNSKTIKISQEK
jgi:hypothetical protein